MCPSVHTYYKQRFLDYHSNSFSHNQVHMEKQKSFSIKPTRFLVFSFTITFSIIFLTFFSIWVLKATPTFHQETHFQFNIPSLSLHTKPLTVQSLTANYSEDNLIGTHIRTPENTAKISSFEGLQRNESELKTPDDQVNNKGDSVNGNLRGATGDISSIGLKNPILVVTNSGRTENASGLAKDLVFEGLERKRNVSQVSVPEIYTVDSVKGHSTSIPKKISDTSDSDRAEEKRKRICDVTKGRWVFDESYPLYTNTSCPFIDEGFNCEANGRFDREYMKWRWLPHDCDIPRFNATKMLELIKGKRLVFVGDSINRNQWESMLCLLMGAIKDSKRVYETRRRRITKEKGNYSFKFVDFKCTVEYYVTHYLVHESKARVGKKRVQTLRIDTMDRGSSKWKGADILVFNTAHWWTHYKTRAGVNYYQERDKVHPSLEVSTAFRRALATWASWVDKHINAGKTQVFFRSSAPSHFRGGQWNAGGHCKEASRPINQSLSIHYPEKNVIAEEIIRQMKTPVTFLNISSLSDYRIDGHPSVYGGRKSEKGYTTSVEDCSHWCLPGVPDTWNELLYFHLLLERRESFAV